MRRAPALVLLFVVLALIHILWLEIWTAFIPKAPLSFLEYSHRIRLDQLGSNASSRSNSLPQKIQALLEGKDNRREALDMLEQTIDRNIKEAELHQLQKASAVPPLSKGVGSSARALFLEEWRSRHQWPPKSPQFEEMKKLNSLPPRNSHLPLLKEEPQLIIVLYVHNRPQYLNVTLDALSKVSGINQTLLIISHDGMYAEVERLVQKVSFCQVKQIHSPFSPHLFHGTFPGTSPDDCRGKERNVQPRIGSCAGTADSFGNYREAKLVSLKHHWWWMMNTVWDGLPETLGFNGHIMFIEEDHYLFPNALTQARELIKAKQQRCSDICSFVMLAPQEPKDHGETWLKQLVIEKVGNIGYTFNRTVWEMIHQQGESFCTFDDYNWDVSLSHAILRKWYAKYALRWSSSSAQHVGTCGLHSTPEEHQNCDKLEIPFLVPEDYLSRVNVSALLLFLRTEDEEEEHFQGWGGWGDERDVLLCRHFSSLYRNASHSSQ